MGGFPFVVSDALQDRAWVATGEVMSWLGDVPGRTSHHISVRKGDGRVLCGCRSVGGLWQVGSRPERSHM